MRRRPAIAVGMAAGGLWGLGVLWIGTRVQTTAPVSAAFLLPGLVVAAMLGRLAQRRFFDDAIIDGEPTTGGAEIDRRVIVNTAEQLVLALCVWPAVAHVRGPGVAVLLGAAFAVARLLFWVGYHVSPPMRAFGFAASFYPTVMAALWTAWLYFVG
jgi:uncharacterized membrane protein YecN with MAPEG domain